MLFRTPLPSYLPGSATWFRVCLSWTFCATTLTSLFKITTHWVPRSLSLPVCLQILDHQLTYCSVSLIMFIVYPSHPPV